VILASLIIGKAAAIFGRQHSTMIQSFGPEARGGACSAQLMMSSSPILYPYVTAPQVLVVMSQEAYTRFAPELQPGGMLLYEQDLVTVNPADHPSQRLFGIPATHLAEELGRKIVLNIVMVGFFAAVTDLVDVAAMRQSVEHSVPGGTEALNLQAFEKGYEFGLAQTQ